MAEPGPLAGHVLELDVGPPGHGGFCVARVDDEPGGRVVFVRHALPGERVRALVTEDGGGSFCRADAVQILRASPERVEPPCPHARPGGCGGCDWQHAGDRAQRALKAQVVREQLGRLAGLDVDVQVAELPGGLLGWRTRIVYAADGTGRLGLHRHRSHRVEVIQACPLGVAGVGDSEVLGRLWPGVSGVEVARGANAVEVLTHQPGTGRPGRQARGRRPPDRVRLVEGPPTLEHTALGRRFTVSAGEFWQVHPHAADALAGAVLDLLAPRTGETAIDLYAGSGLFTAALALAVGRTGRVVGVESATAAVADAAVSLADLPWAEVRRGRIDAELVGALELRADLIVLDPPRAGAGRALMMAVLAGRPRAVAYVACDPAALARDVRVALDAGWTLGELRAFDAFPMTHHVECVALLLPGTASDGASP